jgi:hypothetical protein
MADAVSLLTPLIATAIATAVGGFGAIWGIYTYKEGQKLKRKEILFPLIDELVNSKRMFLAKAIFDDFTCNIPDFSAEESELDKMIIEDIKEPGVMRKYYHADRLSTILRDHNEQGDVTDVREILVRASFDAIIRFYAKLEYLKDIHLLREDEVEYFRYYYDKLRNNEAVRKYVDDYGLSLKFTLFNSTRRKQDEEPSELG